MMHPRLQAGRRGLVLLGWLTAFCGGSAAFAQPTEQSLFVDRQAPAAVLTEAGVVRQRFVDIRVDLLRRARTADSLDLNLFDDVFLAASLDRRDSRGSDRFTWSGPIDSDGGYFVLVVHDGVVAGSVGAPQGRFQIRYKGALGYAIQEIDTSVLPPELDPIPSAPATASIPSSLAADDGSVIDVMVVYTPAARTAAGGAAAIQALITLGETETNIAYDNSQILTNLNVVHTEEVPYAESGSLSTDLSRLGGAVDGFMDNVHALRDTHSADLVKLIVQAGDGCGIAYLMPGTNPLFASLAFSVTRRDCVSPNYTFAHEIGHNEGCNHAPQDPTGLGAFGYSFGYKNPSNLFRTIMAYGCSGGCPRVLHFSNPSVNYLGNPTGTANQNNALSINNVRTTVANFRPSSGTCPTAVALAGHPEARNVRRSLYAFRDEVLGGSRSGRLYTKLFYRYSAEVSRLLTKNDDLRLKTRLLLLRMAPSVEAAASGRSAAVSAEDLAEVSRLLDAFAVRGSLSLKIAIWWFRPRLVDRPSLEDFGFEVARRGGAPAPRTPSPSGVARKPLTKNDLTTPKRIGTEERQELRSRRGRSRPSRGRRNRGPAEPGKGRKIKGIPPNSRESFSGSCGPL